MQPLLVQSEATSPPAEVCSADIDRLMAELKPVTPFRRLVELQRFKRENARNLGSRVTYLDRMIDNARHTLKYRSSFVDGAEAVMELCNALRRGDVLFVRRFLQDNPSLLEVPVRTCLLLEAARVADDEEGRLP